MPAKNEEFEDHDIAAKPPLWAIFALDPKSAQVIIDSATMPPEASANAGYATASNVRNHLQRAALLTKFLEAKPTESQYILQTAHRFIQTAQEQDASFSNADFVVEHQPPEAM